MIVGFIYAFIKAVPAVRDIFLQLQNIYLENEAGKIDDSANEKNAEAFMLATKMKAAVSDQERKILARIIYKNYYRQL